MKIAWVQDDCEYEGGAELSMRELMTQCPYQVVRWSPGDGECPCDVWVVGNCATFTVEELVPFLCTAPVVKRVADWWEVGDSALREWLLTYSAELVFLSPDHLRLFPHRLLVPYTPRVIPPYIELQPFIEASERSRVRKGTLWLGQATDSVRKGVDLAVRWAGRHQEQVDFFGEGLSTEMEFTHGYVKVHGAVPYDEVPALMASYERFLFLPRFKEAFGRTVIEALAAGCKVVTNAVPGSVWYLETGLPIDSAAVDFWRVVEGAANDATNRRRTKAVTS